MIVSDNRVALFVSEGLQTSVSPPYVCMGIERHGQIVAGVILNSFVGTSIELTAYGKGWTREFLRELGRYVFDTLGCVHMTATTAQESVARYAERIGAKREGLLRSHFGHGADGIVVGWLREEWPFI